ncbi:MAG: endolytic transglycosylase MltG, partial [Patescibacteria group bacterium]
GYIFPDTYHITTTATAEEIMDKALSNFGNKLTPELRAEIKAQGKTIYEIITLASIVENEVAKAEDMKIVAGIFWNRLDIGMGLQSDATINYITSGKTTRPTADDLKIDSPYNTYKYRGLPPGPIANPGIASIEAVINPTKTDYLYFLTTPDKQTIFSKTFEEHVAAKNKYLK